MRLWRNVAASTEHKIVFVSSRAGLPREATPGRSYIYGSSKAALNSAARCLALDLAPEGVIAVLVNPGHVQTGIGGADAPMTAAESVDEGAGRDRRPDRSRRGQVPALRRHRAEALDGPARRRPGA